MYAFSPDWSERSLAQKYDNEGIGCLEHAAQASSDSVSTAAAAASSLLLQHFLGEDEKGARMAAVVVGDAEQHRQALMHGRGNRV